MWLGIGLYLSVGPEAGKEWTYWNHICTYLGSQRSEEIVGTPHGNVWYNEIKLFTHADGSTLVAFLYRIACLSHIYDRAFITNPHSFAALVF